VQLDKQTKILIWGAFLQDSKEHARFGQTVKLQQSFEKRA
jgi:hypothetical protein